MIPTLKKLRGGASLSKLGGCQSRDIFRGVPFKKSPCISWLSKEIFVCIFKVLELLNKNKSLDFEALRAFALEDYWSRDKVATRKHI